MRLQKERHGSRRQVIFVPRTTALLLVEKTPLYNHSGCSLAIIKWDFPPITMQLFAVQYELSAESMPFFQQSHFKGGGNNN